MTFFSLTVTVLPFREAWVTVKVIVMWFFIPSLPLLFHAIDSLNILNINFNPARQNNIWSALFVYQNCSNNKLG